MSARLSTMFAHKRKQLTPQREHELMLDAAKRFAGATTDAQRQAAFADWAAGFDGVHADARAAAMDAWADRYLPKAAAAPAAAPIDPNLEPSLAKRDEAHRVEFARSFNDYVRRQPDPLGSLAAQGVPTRPSTPPAVTQSGASPGGRLPDGKIAPHPHGREPAPSPTVFAPRPIEPAPANPVPWRPAPTAVGHAGYSPGGRPAFAPASSHAGSSRP
jgi:hypothetical protein